MRYAVLPAALAIFAALATPSLANGDMKQSPTMFHKAGAACQPGRLRGRAGAGYGWRVGPCTASRR